MSTLLVVSLVVGIIAGISQTIYYVFCLHEKRKVAATSQKVVTESTLEEERNEVQLSTSLEYLKILGLVPICLLLGGIVFMQDYTRNLQIEAVAPSETIRVAQEFLIEVTVMNTSDKSKTISAISFEANLLTGAKIVNVQPPYTNIEIERRLPTMILYKFDSIVIPSHEELVVRFTLEALQPGIYEGYIGAHSTDTRLGIQVPVSKSTIASFEIQ